ncbi:MAG: thioredoxin [Anaerovoracaceae bacterium]|jgi:thioredoxin 1
MSNIINLTEENYENEALKSSIPVLVDFYADWCGPCQALSPVLEAVADKYVGKIKICKLNIDANRKLAISNRVMSIPTLFFIKDGEIVDRVTGGLAQPALENRLDALL